MHHFKWHAGVINNIKDRLAFYKGDVGVDGKPRFAWYTDSEKVDERYSHDWENRHEED